MGRRLLFVLTLVALAGCGAPVAQAPEGREEPAENATRGWQDGYWYDDELAINATDGLNGTEREAVVARSMARVEHIRGLGFEEPVEVEVMTRENFSEELGSGGTDGTRATFENVRFEAMHLVGGTESATDAQGETQAETIGGFYSHETGSIVIISETETPQVDPGTLAHELVHALQDQHFDLVGVTAVDSQDASNGRLGLVEGDAEVVRFEYEERCGEEWECVEYPDTEGEPDAGDSEIHMGLHINSLFPYSDGPTFVEGLRDGENWSAVNDAYDDPPNTSREIIEPGEYGEFEPTEVAVADRTSDGWERVTVPDGPRYEVVGQSGLTAMFAYTLYDESSTEPLVEPFAFLNIEDGEVDERDPLNYGLSPTEGWTGDRLHVYERDNQTAYVWRLRWETADEAATFTDQYHGLLRYWGGERLGDDTWLIGNDSEFADAYRVSTDGDTVTIVNAPTETELDNVHGS